MSDKFDDVTMTRVDSIITISDNIIKVILDQMDIHGRNDPNLSQVVISGLAMSVLRINKLVPGFKEATRDMLDTDVLQ